MRLHTSEGLLLGESRQTVQKSSALQALGCLLHALIRAAGLGGLPLRFSRLLRRLCGLLSVLLFAAALPWRQEWLLHGILWLLRVGVRHRDVVRHAVLASVLLGVRARELWRWRRKSSPDFLR